MREISSSERSDVCATCAMVLALPGLLSNGRTYCCHGCVPALGESAGAIYAPNRPGGLETARAIRIEASPVEVSRFLARIELLPLYEQKIDRLLVTATSADRRRACATVDGEFGLLPFHIELHFDFDAVEGGGYKSTLCDRGPLSALRGGFVVRPDGNGSIVTHFENYQFDRGALERLVRLIRPYVAWSMERELRALKRLVEEPGTVGVALRMRRPHQLPIDPAVEVWDPERPERRRRGHFAVAPTPEILRPLAAIAFGAAAVGAGVAVARKLGRRS